MADDLTYEELVQMLVVTAAVVGAPTLTPAVAHAMMTRLGGYPSAQVVRALERCQEELRGRVALADVLERIKRQDGRPGAEEAWAMASAARDESRTIVWTEEMAEAYGLARELHLEDHVAARVAFKEVYDRLCAHSRGVAKPVKWTPSFGHDARQRASAIKEAIALGQLPRSALYSVSGECGDEQRALPTDSGSQEYVGPPPEVAAFLARKVGE